MNARLWFQQRRDLRDCGLPALFVVMSKGIKLLEHFVRYVLASEVFLEDGDLAEGLFVAGVLRRS